jgi:calcineurin-like phosphoesterase family protein
MGYLPGLYDIFQERWGQSQSCYIYSDPHFGDDELTDGIKNRPSAKEQVKKINAKCGRCDTFICLGDIGDVEYVRQLRAEYKILVMGNHDAGISNYKRQVVKEIYDQTEVSKEECLADMRNKYPNWKITIHEEWDFHAPFQKWIASADNMLFDEVYEGPLVIGEKLILSHEPIVASWAFNIHGHIHDLRHKNTACHFNVCSDLVDYTPINLNQLLKSGILSKVESIHRTTIDKATKKAQRKTLT